MLDMNTLDTTLWSVFLRPCQSDLKADGFCEHKFIVDETRRFVLRKISHGAFGLAIVVPRIDKQRRRRRREDFDVPKLDS